MLCGTREDVAEKALRFHTETGLGLPLLQPVLQEDRQIDELVAAAALYASAETASVRESREPVGVAAASSTAGAIATSESPAPATDALADDRRLGAPERLRRRAAGVWEILRPFAYTASVIPVLAGAALAWGDGRWAWLPFLAALAGGILLHSGTNVINEIYDVRKGIDTITSPRASHALVKGRLTERQAFAIAFAFFGLAVLAGLGLTFLRGWPIVALGLIGLAGVYFYTAPPFQYKFHALGVPIVFLLMGPLMTVGAYFAVSGAWSTTAFWLSLPIGLLVAAILHGNEWRDISEDTRAGITTLSSRTGRDSAHYAYL